MGWHQQLQLGVLLKKFSATDQTVFMMIKASVFLLSFQTNQYPFKYNIFYTKYSDQAFEKELDLDLSQFNESPDVLIYKTKARSNNQVVFQIEPLS